MAHGDLRLEVWTRPGSTLFERKDIQPPGPFSGTKRMATGIGRGQLTVPITYERINELIRRTPGDPATDIRRLARVYAEGVTLPVFEFFLDTTSDEVVETDVTIGGASIESIMADGIVYPWDWDGSALFESSWPDWIWGGKDIVGPVEVTMAAHIFTLYTDATSGSFQVGVSLNGGAYNYTSINFDDSDFEVEQAMESLGNVDVVDVEGIGTEENPWQISILEPAGDYTVALGSTSLVGGRAYLTLTQFGGLMPVGWTQSLIGTTSTPHGVLTDFRASLGGGADPVLPAACSAWVVFLGQEFFFPGVQTVRNVIPGGIYWLPPIYLYAQGAPADVRVVIRDLNENLLAYEEVSLAANTLTLTTGVWQGPAVVNGNLILIPDGVYQIVYRVGHIGAGTPPRIFVACPSMREGLAPTSAGGIFDALFDDATLNHIFNGRVVWENLASPGTTFLDLSFTTAVDSAGVAWDNMAMDFTAKRGKTYQQVLQDLANRGYRWSVTPSNTAGRWLVNLYNPSWIKVNATALPTPAINVGSGVTSGPIVRSHLTGNVVTVEGYQMKFAHEEAGLSVASIGRREIYQSDRTITTTDAALVRAVQEVGARLYGGLSVALNIDPVGGPVPLADYDVDWQVNVQVPPVLPKSAHRVAAITFNVADDTKYTVSFSSEAFTGQAAVEEGTRRLLEKYEGFERDDPVSAPMAMGGPGSGPIAIYSLPGQAFVEVGRLRYYFPFGGTMTWATVSANVAPTGAAMIVDVNVNGVSIYGSPASRPTIPAGSNVSPISTFTVQVPVFGYVTVDIDQVGSTLPGGDVTIQIGGPAPGGWLAT